MFTGIAGTHVQGLRVHVKNGVTSLLSLVGLCGGNTCTVSEVGGEAPFEVVGSEKEKRARCLGMFQFNRPLYAVVS